MNDRGHVMLERKDVPTTSPEAQVRLFLFMGLTRTFVAFAARGQQGAGLVGLSGIAGLLIGILVLAKFPSSADWAIGLLVGIDLIFAGWTLTSVALVGRDLSRA